MMSGQSERVYRTNLMRLENLSTAMLFVCTAILFSLGPLKPEELDNSLKWALYCVTFALPASALGFLIKLERERFGRSLPVVSFWKCFVAAISKFRKVTSNDEDYKNHSDNLTITSRIILSLAAIGLIAGIFGVACLFFHFSVLHGVIFGFFTWLFGLFYICLSYAIDEELSKNTEPAQQEDSEKST